MLRGDFIRILAAAAATAAGRGLAAAQAAPSLEAVARKLESGDGVARVACFGDSITGVYYHTGSRRAWPDLLGIALRKRWPAARVDIVNAGRSGNTTDQALARMERDVLSARPDLVAVMFGMNDVARTAPRDFERNLQQIADRARGAGAAVAFCTPNTAAETPERPRAKLAEYSAIVRRVAASRGWPAADLFSKWEALRQRDEEAWDALMSEAIHPNLNGHRDVAALVASAIAGEPVELGEADVPPAPDPLSTTLDRLEAGLEVKIVAMPPYDRIVPERLRARFPGSRLDVHAWPVREEGADPASGAWSEADRAAAKAGAKVIREMRPHLVVIAPPAAMGGADRAAFRDDARWMLNLAFPFAAREWDVLAVLPGVHHPGAALDPAREAEFLAMARGKDLAPLFRTRDDLRPAAELLDAALFP